MTIPHGSEPHTFGGNFHRPRRLGVWIDTRWYGREFPDELPGENATDEQRAQDPYNDGPLFALLQLGQSLATLRAIRGLLIFGISAIWLNSDSAGHSKPVLKQWIQYELIFINFPPSGKKVDALYVSGGSQESLKVKFETTA